MQFCISGQPRNHLLHKPGHFRPGKIGRQRNPGFFKDQLSAFLSSLHYFLGPVALPDDGRIQGPAILVPKNRSLSLVADPYGGQAFPGNACPFHRHLHCPDYVPVYFFRVMGDPAQFVDHLPVGHIGPVYDVSFPVKQYCLGSLGTLVDSDDIFHNKPSAFWFRRRLYAGPVFSW